MDKPKKVGDGLRKLLEHFGMEGVWQASEVADNFKKVFSSYPGTEFVEFDKGVMVVAVRSAAVRNELSFKKQELIEVMNRFIGEDMVKDIRFTGPRRRRR